MLPLRHLALAASLALGEALGFAFGDFCSAWPIAAFFTALFVIGGYGFRLRHWVFLAVFFAGIALALKSENSRMDVLLGSDRDGGPFTASVTVEDRVLEGDRWTSFDSSAGNVALKVMIPTATLKTRPEVGDSWRLCGWIERRDLSDRRRRRVWISGASSFAERVATTDGFSWRRLLASVRARLSRSAGIGLDHAPIDVGLDRAILFGERSNIPETERRMFVDAGTVHVFAISGLHVMVIAGIMVYALMLVFAFPLRLMGLAVVPLLAGYVVLIGAPPSAVRALAMATVYFAAPICWRKSDSLVAWALAFLAFHIIDPQLLYDIGSMLSFVIMLGILLFIRWASVFRSRAVTAIGVPFAAWAAGVPIIARVFGMVTPGGLLANFAIVPIAALGVVLGFLGSLVGCVCPFVGAHLNNAAALMTEAMRGISWSVAQLPYAQLEVAPWSMGSCLAWYVTLALALWLVRSVVIRRRTRL